MGGGRGGSESNSSFIVTMDTIINFNNLIKTSLGYVQTKVSPNLYRQPDFFQESIE